MPLEGVKFYRSPVEPHSLTVSVVKPLTFDALLSAALIAYFVVFYIVINQPRSVKEAIDLFGASAKAASK